MFGTRKKNIEVDQKKKKEIKMMKILRRGTIYEPSRDSRRHAQTNPDKRFYINEVRVDSFV